MKMTISELTCKKCNYSWFPKTEEEPKVCPKCKSYRWKEPRKTKNKNSNHI